MRRLGLPALILALVVFSCIGCREASQQPGDSRDDSGGAPRIVALSPAVAIMLQDLGCADLIVGRHFHDLALDASIPVVGDQSGIDYERLIAVNPSLIVLEWGSQRAIPDQLSDLAADRGWKIVNLELLTLDQIRDGMNQLATHVGRPEAERRAEALSGRMDEVWREQPDLAERAGRTLALFWTDPAGAPGPGSFHYQLLERLGVQMALTKGAAYVTLDPESVRMLDPDSILLFLPGAAESDPVALLGPLSDIGLRAVRNGHVGVVRSADCLTPSTSMIEVASEIANVIEGWSTTAPALED